jgi:XRE family transcriptional regulator, regulator of sulfur utilization
MDELAQAIGANVRRLRERSRMSLSELAQRSGIAKSTLSQLESGTTNPTVSTLSALSEALSVDIRDLLSVDVQKHEVLVVRRGVGTDVSGESSTGQMVRSLTVGPSVVEFHRLELRPGTHETSASHGVGSREHVLVTDGQLTVGPEGSTVTLHEGDYASYPADQVHRWINDGDAVARYWIVASYPRSLHQ